MLKKKEEKQVRTITIEPIRVKHAIIKIEGDTDLCLNKMNARNTRELIEEREDKGKKVRQIPNMWEDLITAIHWRDGLPTEDTYNECDEQMLKDLLTNNAPCIPTFGFKKSFGQAVVRNGIDKYATKFDTSMNLITPNNLVPVKFASYGFKSMLMSPTRGRPVLVRLNCFSGWSAEFQIQFVEHVFGLEAIVNIINLAGFGLGIGSGRPSGYGRYHVVDVV